MAIFTNQAQLSYNNGVVNSNVATGELVEVLSATKTAVMDDYRRNDDVTYVISIVNAGTAPFTGLQVQDDLGAYPFDNTTLYPLTYVDGSLRVYVNGVLQTTAPTVEAGPPLVISGLTVPAGGNLMLIYEAEVNGFAPLAADSTIVNTAVISGGGLSTPITVTEDIETEQEPELSITKFVEPTTVSENGVITYTFVIQNLGNTAAVVEDDVIVTDTFDPILTDLTVTVNGDVLPAVAYTYDEATGQFSTDPSRITVPAATYTQDPVTGLWVITPGVTVLTVSGTV